MFRIDRELRRFKPSDAADLYEVDRWGKGYFSINDQGHAAVHPAKDPAVGIDLKLLVDRLESRGVKPPILLRFGDVLEHRLADVQAAFRRAINELHYKADYRCIFPIKVNQQRQVIQDVLRFGRPSRCGLEAGSKPELLAVLAMADNDLPIVCNGFKDAQFIETALLAQKMGRRIFLVVEKSTELEPILHYAREIGVRPRIGTRVKLASPGSGRWHASGGYRSKFGLSASEVLDALELLKRHDMQDCYRLLHFHLGSQITNIRHIKAALNEAARIYADLVRHGAGLAYLDVGGGLGVDYDGSMTNFDSSVNYTLQEYANDVVFHVQTVCDDAGVAHPRLFSESGRAVAAYHSLLVFDVLGVSRPGETAFYADRSEQGPRKPSADAEQPLRDLWDTFQELNVRNLMESFHDAQEALDMAMSLFGGGYLPLRQRSQAENLFWAILRKLRRLVDQLEDVPEELQGLDAALAETYFCNFSLFQSLPDSWAVRQIFPVMPLHRLNERPDRDAVLADATCDSDGKIDRFVSRRDVSRTLPLHALDGQPYYLGVFLVGAYQEILGDLHNLFGDTNTVHVSLDDDGAARVDAVIAGDTIRDVLGYVQFDADDLTARLRASIEQATIAGRIDRRQADRLLQSYQAALEGSTYPERSSTPQRLGQSGPHSQPPDPSTIDVARKSPG